mgnify:CR=1 FL=1
MKKFDLNIEKILENWETHHAIREIIANAIDEKLLTNSKDVEILKNRKAWRIRDFGRGLKYSHLTQKENKEKLSNPNVIGKFGIGLKDALATLDRQKKKILIKSKFGDITLDKSAKQDFKDIVTLHALISDPSDKKMIGTEFVLDGVSDKDIDKAKQLFLIFSGEKIIETTKYGQIVEKKGDTANIYINGVKVAEEENFLISYNITSLTSAIKKALNRERTNVGRTAYSDSVKKILLSSKSTTVAEMLAKDLKNIDIGTAHDEMKWIDVQEHAVKLLNQAGKYLFATSFEIMSHTDMIDEARTSGHSIITIPENLKHKIEGIEDFSGNPINDILQFVSNYNDSFEFNFIEPNKLTAKEKVNFNYTDDILNLIGGKPKAVKEIKISTTMRKDISVRGETVGVWHPTDSSIIILRRMLKSIKDYSGTLIHEALHAKSGQGDVSRAFERELTVAIGQVCEIALKDKKPSGKLK